MVTLKPGYSHVKQFKSILKLVGGVCVCEYFSHVWFCNPMDCNPSGSSVCEISQVTILEWLAISFSRGIFPTQGSNLSLLHCRQIFYHLSHQGNKDISEKNLFLKVREGASIFMLQDIGHYLLKMWGYFITDLNPIQVIFKQEKEILSLGGGNRVTSEKFAFDSWLGMLFFPFCEVCKYSWRTYLISYERDIVSLECGGGEVADGPFSRLCVLQKERDAFWKPGVLQSQQVHHYVLFFLCFFKSSQD